MARDRDGDRRERQRQAGGEARAAPEPPANKSYASPTVATPISACGTSRLHDENPNTLAESACTHRLKGGLSTVMIPFASNEPYRKACQLWAIERTAAL